ncbi:hypothetical protein [Streptomyces sp. NPDC002952]|uniref:hypothetical protein n=1 Tax=Streptomyces sp. NPDC002952 TaxID=3364673 RepID=UPI00368F9670
MTSPARSSTPSLTVIPFRDISVGWRGLYLRIRRLPLNVCDTTTILQDLRAFRAEILYAAGRRPEFRAPDGRFVDTHILDHGAYHLTVHPDPSMPPSGYIRLAPSVLTSHFQTRALLGEDRFIALLATHEMAQSGVFEHSRLVVAEDARGAGLGILMNAAAIASARALGAAGMVGICGMDDGQHHLQQRFGFTICPDTEHYSTYYQDHVCVISRQIGNMNDEHEDLVHQLHQRIVSRINHSVEVMAK